MIEKIIVDRLISNKAHPVPFVLAICGAADLGKSFLAKQISKQLIIHGFQATCFGLDAYLLPREKRLALQLSGYQYESHYLNQAFKDLSKLKEQQSISYYPYDHQQGSASDEAELIQAKDFILFEGLFTLHQLFQPLIDYAVFVFTADDTLKIIRKEADLVKRNYSKAFSQQIAGTEFALYKKNIEPLGRLADCHLFLAKKWQYELVELNKN